MSKSLPRSASFAVAVTLAACTTHTLDVGSNDAADAAGPPPVPVGTPCIPSPELSTSFLGFDSREVVVDRDNAACGTGVCLANHFQGRASCPYGQNESATAASTVPTGHARCGSGTPAPSDPCCTPGSDQAVLSSLDVGASTPAHSAVLPQCSDRTAARVVTCSCRCANPQGKTDDGEAYCACPSGAECEQLVPELVAGDPLAGGYCVLDDTAYDAATSCSSPCNPGTDDCPPPKVPALPTAHASAAAYFVMRVQQLEPGNVGCVQPPLTPTDADGEIACQVYDVLAAGDACSNHAGLSTADSVVQAAVVAAAPPAGPVCQLAQLPPPCTSSSQVGWCYATGPIAGAETGCAQAVQLSPAAALPAGAYAVFVCP